MIGREKMLKISLTFVLLFSIISIFFGYSSCLHAEEDVKINKENARVYLNKAEGYYGNENYERTILESYKALLEDPNSYEANILIARCEYKIKQIGKKEIKKEEAAVAGETGEDYYRMWLESFDEGEYGKSIDFMKKAVELSPAYSSKIKTHLEESEAEFIARDVERKKKEVLAKETARALEEKKRGSGKKSPVKRRPLKFGPLTMNPSLAYKFTWDDNIYLTDTDERADYISQFSPGLDAKLDLPFGLPFISMGGGGVGFTFGKEDRTLINLEYKPDFKSFLEHTEESNIGHTFIGTSIIPSNLFGGRGKLIFGFRDIFKYTTDPASSEQGKFTPRYNNDMEAKAKYAVSQKVSTAVAYRQILEWYTMETRQSFNYTKYSLTPTVYYNLTGKSSLFLDTEFTRIVYHTGNRNSAYLETSAGLTGQVTAKTNVYFKVGGQFRSYEHDELYKGYTAFTTRGSLSSQLRKDVFIKLTFNKDAVESTYQGNAYFDLKQADFELIKNLTGKLSMMAGGTFGRNDYPRDSNEGDAGDRVRRDYVWGLRTGFSYQLLKGLDSSISYEFRGRDSNFMVYDYRDNRIVTNIRATY